MHAAKFLVAIGAKGCPIGGDKRPLVAVDSVHDWAARNIP
jgi:hypothetical protein